MTTDLLTERYSGLRAAVVGASGFIGRRVTAHLNAAGADVLALVRDPVAARPNLEAEAPGAKIVGFDLLDEARVEECLTLFRPAILFNLAGYGVDRQERDPDLALRLNVEAVRMLARVLAKARDRHFDGTAFVHVGSALEYGRARGDLSETTTPLPFETYGRTKLAGTLGLESEAKGLGLPASTARLFTVFGPGEHPGRLLPTLLEGRRGDAVIPLSEGLQRRDFTAVDDVAEGLLRLGLTHPGATGAAINLATGTLTTVRAFAERAAKVLGIDSERLGFGRIPVRAEEMEHDAVSIARLRSLTGWAPSLSIEEGVRRAARKGG